MPPAPTATTSGQALQNLQTAQSTQQTPDQIQQSTDQSLGVPGAQQQVSGLRQAITNTTNLLNGVAPSVEGRTQNSLETSAQANREIQNEQAPISQTLGGQNTALSNDQSDLSNLLSQASTEEGLKEQGQTDTLTNLQNIYNDLYGQEQNTAQANVTAAQQAEAVREFNAGLAEKTQADQASNASSSSPSAAQLQQQDAAGAAQYLQSLAGGDGHVSQSTWNNAMAQWTAAGYKATDFVNQYKQYINQKYTGYHGFD